MDKGILLYKAPVLKGFLVVFILALFLAFFPFLFNPSLLKNIPDSFSVVNSLLKPLGISVLALFGGYSLSLLSTYQTLSLAGGVMTLTNIYGRTRTRPVSALKKVSPGRSAYTFCFQRPDGKEESATLYCYTSPAKFESVLEALARGRMTKEPVFVFEYGKIRKEF